MTANPASVNCNDDAPVERKHKKIKKNKKRHKNTKDNDAGILLVLTVMSLTTILNINGQTYLHIAWIVFHIVFYHMVLGQAIMNPQFSSTFALQHWWNTSKLTANTIQNPRIYYNTTLWSPPYENHANSNCKKYNLPNYPRCMVEEVSCQYLFKSTHEYSNGNCK